MEKLLTEELTDVGAGIQISPNAIPVLRHISCHEQLKQVACEIKGTLTLSSKAMTGLREIKA